MSLSFTNLTPVKMMDPRINIVEKKEYVFQTGGNIVTYKTYSTNSASTSSIQFSCTPPSPNIIVSGYVVLSMNLGGRATVTTNAGIAANACGGTVFSTKEGVHVAPRQFPLSSIIKTLSVKINNDTVTVNLCDYIHALGRYYLSQEIRANEFGQFPSQPDLTQSYDDYEDVGKNNFPLIGNGARNPFFPIAVNSTESTRASFAPLKLASEQADPSGFVDFMYRFAEPLFVSPLSNGAYSSPGLTQVQNMDFNISLNSSFYRFLSVRSLATHGPIVIEPSASANFPQISNVGMSFIYITPQITQKLPETVIYPYNEIQRITKDINTVFPANNPGDIQITGYMQDPPTASKVVIVNSDNIQLSAIPSRVYIYARRKDADSTPHTTDTFLNISSINIDFNGASGILASATQEDLYRMSVANGLRMSYQEYSLFTGSVLCISFGSNLGLSPQQAVGSIGTWNWSYSVGLRNLSREPINATLYTVFDTPGLYNISRLNVIRQLGIMSASDVINSDEVKNINLDDVEQHGGSFMSGVKTLYNKTRTLANKAAPYVKKGAEFMEDAAQFGEKYAQDHPKLVSGLKTGAKIAARLSPLLLAAGYNKKQVKEIMASGQGEKLLKKYNKYGLGGLSVGGLSLAGGLEDNNRARFAGGAMAGKQKLAQRAMEYY